MPHSRTAADPFPGVIGTFMGRDALRLAVSALDLAPTDVALLPAYLCVEVLKPFQTRCNVRFFDVGPDTAIDPQILVRQLTKHRPKVVLFINYFGFLQPRRAEIQKLCAANGALLIEDCAHSLLTEGSGKTGDWVIHSFRKILPLPDGGGLKANTHPERLAPQFRPRLLTDILSALILLKSKLKVTHDAFSRSGLTVRSRPTAPATSPPPGNPRLLPMSSVARRRMKRLDFAALTAQRRQDFQFWLEWTAQVPGAVPLFDCLPPGVCPMGFPILLPDREPVKSRLEKDGLVMRTHWHLPEAVGAEHVHAHHLARRSLTLPLGHELSKKDRHCAMRFAAELSHRGALAAGPARTCSKHELAGPEAGAPAGPTGLGRTRATKLTQGSAGGATLG